MSKKLAIVGAVVLILFGLAGLCIGLFYLWAASAPGAASGWVTTGVITALFGLLILGGGIGLLVWAGRQPAAGQGGAGVTLKIDLPGNVSMDSIKCKSCGGTLKAENIQMVAGAPVVTCPYCHTTYQLTEEPKW